MELAVNWIAANWLEIVATIIGLIGIGLQIKQNHWYWLSSILMVSLYIPVFYKSGFYADMSFQFYYLAVSIYGWYYWIKNRKKESNNKKTLSVNRLSFRAKINFSVISIIVFIIIYEILISFTDSTIPVGDAFTTALSIVATWLLARKYIENWILWIAVDAVSTGLYIYKGLYPTAILFTVLTVLAIVGYFEWKHSIKKSDICPQ